MGHRGVGRRFFGGSGDGGDVSIYKKCQEVGSEILEVRSCQITRGD